MAKALQITARPANGFRRAGVHHPPHPVLHEPGRFSETQVKQLLAEPNLVVTLVDLPASTEPPPAEPAAKAETGKGKK
jgi:hypothetical protein